MISSIAPENLSSRSVVAPPVEDPLEALRGLQRKARDLTRRHGDAARLFRQSAAVGGVLAEVGVRWLEEEWGFPSQATRKAAAHLRSSWRETPTCQELEREAHALIDEARSALSRVFVRLPSLKNARQAALVNTKCARLDAVLDDAIARAEKWIGSGKQLPVRPESPPRRAPRQNQLDRPPTSQSRPIARTVPGRKLSHETPGSRHWTEWLSLVAAFFGVAAFASAGFALFADVGTALAGGVTVALALTIAIRTAWSKRHGS